MKKFFCAVLIVCFVISSQFCISAAEAQPALEQGTILAISGKAEEDPTCLRYSDYVDLSEYAGVGINNGYEIAVFVYDIDENYLGASGWLGNGRGFTTESLISVYPMGAYFKLVIRKAEKSNISIMETFASGLTFYDQGQQMPDSVVSISADFKLEDVMDIGSWQDGAIFDKKLFVFGRRGSGAVYSLETKQKLADIDSENNLILAVNPNSVSFSSQYYDKNDKYPLLYANIYGGFGFMPKGFEGICCVFRVLENKGKFLVKLVQVINIGFAEDLDLWKSLEDGGDRNSSGNFVVDADNNKLYTFVTRDKEKVTRFFKFDIPTMDEGEDNAFYGCKVVTLNKEDIKDRFDVQYFNYMKGCDYLDGKIISSEGLGPSQYITPAIRLVDLKAREVVKTYHPSAYEVSAEPTLVAVDNKNGDIYYAADDGMLRKLVLSQESQNNAERENAKNGKLSKVLWGIALAAAALLIIGATAGFVATLKRKTQH